jgi:hypothetical protein
MECRVEMKKPYSVQRTSRFWQEAERQKRMECLEKGLKVKSEGSTTASRGKSALGKSRDDRMKQMNHDSIRHVSSLGAQI